METPGTNIPYKGKECSCPVEEETQTHSKEQMPNRMTDLIMGISNPDLDSLDNGVTVDELGIEDAQKQYQFRGDMESIISEHLVADELKQAVKAARKILSDKLELVDEQ